jgi:hypothetical protein
MLNLGLCSGNSRTDYTASSTPHESLSGTVAGPTTTTRDDALGSVRVIKNRCHSRVTVARSSIPVVTDANDHVVVWSDARKGMVSSTAGNCL